MQRESFRLRREAALLVWGEAGRPLELVTQIEPVGRHTPSAGAMTVTAPSGETMKLKPEAKEHNSAYNFTPQRTGPHRLHWQGDSAATLRPVHCSTPVAILGEPLGMNLIRPVGTVHFPVPTGVRRFALQIAGQGTAETVKITIRDATGRTVDQRDNIAAPHVFVLERDSATATEIWAITFQPAGEGVLEDVSVQTLGVPPIFGATPRDVFIPALPE